MKKWNMIIDVAECTNCNLCTLASMDEYVGNEWPGYSAPMPRHGHRWINILQKERGQVPMVDVAYVPTMCNHCDDPPCMKADRVGAIRKRADGIVIIDPQKARGQRQLVEACPYGQIHWNEELGLPQAWPFDAHLLDQGWPHPRGHQSCPTGAMRAIKVEDEDMARIAREQGLEVLKPELGAKPRVYYKNLWRYTKCFIGGTVSHETNGIVDCVEGAQARLVKGGTTVAEVMTDNYGDFKFDGLEEGSGRYRVEIAVGGKVRTAIETTLGASINLGEIRV
jgi:Fe-S-cluster-containing dehydrogenase component